MPIKLYICILIYDFHAYFAFIFNYIYVRFDYILIYMNVIKELVAVARKPLVVLQALEMALIPVPNPVNLAL